MLTEKNPQYFYDANAFPFLSPLVKNFEVIKAELNALLASGADEQWQRIFPDYVKSEREKAWQTFTFLLFSIKFTDNAACCPQTTKLLTSIPEIISCDFSKLKPHTHIAPHKGYSKMVLRCHLPLIVPNEQLCGIRVGDETRHWREGELMIFDDSYEHEAWNKSGQERSVLMFDIPNPLWGHSGKEISKFKIENLEDPFLLSYANKETWMKLFEMGEIPSQLPK